MMRETTNPYMSPVPPGVEFAVEIQLSERVPPDPLNGTSQPWGPTHIPSTHRRKSGTPLFLPQRARRHLPEPVFFVPLTAASPWD